MAYFPAEDTELGDDFRRSQSVGQTQLFELRAEDVLGFRFGTDSAGHASFIAVPRENVF